MRTLTLSLLVSLLAGATTATVPEVALAHADGYHIARVAGDYTVEMEFEAGQDIPAKTSVPVSVRLERTGSKDTITYDAVQVTITDAQNAVILDAALAEDSFYVGTSAFSLTLPDPGIYTTHLRFEKGRGEQAEILAESEDLTFRVLPETGLPTGSPLPAIGAFLLGLAVLGVLTWRVLTARRHIPK